MNESTQLLRSLTVNISAVCFCRNVISTQYNEGSCEVSRERQYCTYLGYVSQKIHIQNYTESLVMGLILPHGARGQNHISA